MAVVCFVSYEIHPTTMGGCGVLIHHAADLLLARGHEIVLLLDMPDADFRRFVERDRPTFAKPSACRAYQVEALCTDFPYSPADVPCIFQLKSLRFAHALDRLLACERPDVVEFFDYCGPGYYAMARRLFAADDAGPVLAIRLHGSMQVLDRLGGGGRVDRDHALLYGLEHRALELAEAILAPSATCAERYYGPLHSLDAGRVLVSPPPKQSFLRVTRRPDPHGPFAIAFIGRLCAVKGVDQLVHAAVRLMKRRPDLGCAVELMGYESEPGPGGGTYGAYLRTLVPERLRDRFRFLGQVPHDEVARRLNDALFAVFPNRVETFCYALHEVYDAGVPVIVNDLPSFADFFQHERNALVYDGTTEGLIRAMERLIDDRTLCDRLCRPYAVAEATLGDFYDRPWAKRPLVPPDEARVWPLVAVLGGAEGGGEAVRSLTRQTFRDFDVVLLAPEEPEHHEAFWWLGRRWDVRDPEGRPLEPSDLRTTDALLVLHHGDRLHETWMERSVRALARRPELAFAGTWLRREGRVVPSPLDLVPELLPFEQGASLTRVLMRTERGQPLDEVFDPVWGNLGEIAYLWSAVAGRGSGCLLPEPLVEAASEERILDAEQLAVLLFRQTPPDAGRAPLMAGILLDELRSMRPATALAPGVMLPKSAAAWREHREGLTEQLGGRVLAGLALRRLVRRLRG